MLIVNGTIVGYIKSQSLFIQIEVTHTRSLSSLDYKLLCRTVSLSLTFSTHHLSAFEKVD